LDHDGLVVFAEGRALAPVSHYGESEHQACLKPNKNRRI
jgi:hypothetical protein